MDGISPADIITFKVVMWSIVVFLFLHGFWN